MARAANAAQGGESIHGSFHIDALIIFMALAALLTMLLRFVWNRIVKFARHVIWMRRKAHGTLVSDAEAAYWLKLIERPDYKPVWRWFYAEEWRKKHALGVPQKVKKTSTARKVGYVNAGLAVVIVSLLLLSGARLSAGWAPIEFPTATRLSVLAAYNATLMADMGTQSFYRANGMFEPPTAVVAFEFLLERTDSAFSTREVFFNLLSGEYGNGRTDGGGTYYIINATYVVDTPTGAEAYIIASDNDQFGIVFEIPANGAAHFIVFIRLRDYTPYPGDTLASMESTGGDRQIFLHAPQSFLPPPIPPPG